MSNVALFGGSSVPAFVKARGELSAVAKALAGGGAGGGKRISIKGGVFRLMSAGKEVAAIDERYLDVVIVNAAPKVSRTFYMAQYDSDKVSAPDCWSADGVTPAADANNRQSDKCDTCHHASKPEKAMKAKQEKCQNCHEKAATAPMKTNAKAAFHDAMAKKGICVGCHVKEAAAGKKTPTKCNECHNVK